jgi:GPH family glycoside/pentoside/hexuronide:cation symporter
MIVGGIAPERASHFLSMGLIFGLVSMLPLFLVFMGTRERPAFMQQEQPKLLNSLKAAARNRPFVFSVAIFLLTWVAIDILQATLLYFIKYVVQRESQSDMIMGLIFITAIFALPIWAWLSRIWSKRWAYVAGISFWAVVQLVLISLNASTSLTLILSLCVLAGVGVGAAHVLPWSIIPDAIEWDEWQTGQRHEGIFYSLVTLMQKVATSIAIPLTLVLLGATGYVPNAPEQPASAIMGIRLVIGPIPAALLCLGIAFAVLYPLGREQHAKVVAELENRRMSGRIPLP